MTTSRSTVNRTSALKCAFAGLALAGFAHISAAQAAAPEPIGTYKDWKAFSMTEGNTKVCFVVSQPSDMSPKNVRRGDVFFLVTDWGDGKPEPSIITGYTYRPNSKTKIQIGSDKFDLFTDGDGAWFRSEETETKLVNAMKRGNSMTVTGTSDRGTLTTDKYSLSGITAALDKLKRTCN